ncbi:endonuclease domain-containing protein [soil metagenome]
MRDRTIMFARAKGLRRESTDAERAVWRMLRGRALEGRKFRRQVPLGPYIADFACFDPKVVIECDGSQHVDSAYDEERDAWFRREGFKVLRFWSDHVLREPEGVADAILAAVRRP